MENSLSREIIEWESSSRLQILKDGLEIAFLRIDKHKYVSSTWYIIELETDSNHRRMGYAYKLFNFLRQKAKDADIKELKLTASGDGKDIDSEQLVKIYSKWGFEVDQGETYKMTYYLNPNPHTIKAE